MDRFFNDVLKMNDRVNVNDWEAYRKKWL